jgi:hypothetical protein
MISTSVITSASAAEIWRIWTDVEHSPVWDTDVAWSRLDGPLFVGTRGAFKLDQVAYQQHYSNTVKLPGIALTFSHHIEPLSAQEIRITHGAVIRGPVGFMLAPLLKLKLRKALTDSLQRMVALAVIDQV